MPSSKKKSKKKTTKNKPNVGSAKPKAALPQPAGTSLVFTPGKTPSRPSEKNEGHKTHNASIKKALPERVGDLNEKGNHPDPNISVEDSLGISVGCWKLIAAVREGNMGAVQEILASKIDDVNSMGVDMNRPAWKASANGANGVALVSQNTALFEAVDVGGLGIAQVLLDAGANPNLMTVNMSCDGEGKVRDGGAAKERENGQVQLGICEFANHAAHGGGPL